MSAIAKNSPKKCNFTQIHVNWKTITEIKKNLIGGKMISISRSTHPEIKKKMLMTHVGVMALYL